MCAISVNSERVRRIQPLLIFVSEQQGLANRSSKSNRFKGHQVGFGKKNNNKKKAVLPLLMYCRYCRLQSGAASQRVIGGTYCRVFVLTEIVESEVEEAVRVMTVGSTLVPCFIK